MTETEPPTTTREVTRLITYRGTADAMAKQLGRSLPDGMREGKVDITVRTLEDSAGLLLGTADPVAGMLRRLHEVEREREAARLAARDAGNELQRLREQVKTARQEAADARANLAQWQSVHGPQTVRQSAAAPVSHVPTDSEITAAVNSR